MLIYRSFDKIALLKEIEEIKMNLDERSSYEKNIIQKAVDKGLPIENTLTLTFLFGLLSI